MTANGQITIPKDVRDELALEPGSRVSFIKNEDGYFELHRERRPVTELDDQVPGVLVVVGDQVPSG
ncbi:MAG: AbrB/MazE/SpoVT family DNA-binding domain-containing protein [Micropruina sp.]